MVQPTSADAEAVVNRDFEILFMYGSQTGNCKEISKDLLETLNDDASVLAGKRITRCKLNKYKRAKLTDKSAGIKIVVFFCSSTGDGESPENSLEFFRFLRRETAKVDEEAEKSGSGILSHVFYTVLGLGDSNYSKYQGAPRFLDARLQMLGATCFSPRVEADEATSLELVIEPWLETIGGILSTQALKVRQMADEEVAKRLKTSTPAADMAE